MFALCTNNMAAANQANLQKSVDSMKKYYSLDVQAFALYLCSKIPKVSVRTLCFRPGRSSFCFWFQTIDSVLEMLRPRILQEHDEALMYVSLSDRISDCLLVLVF